MGGQSAWKLQYDQDGCVNEVVYHRSVRQISSDQRGCVMVAGGVVYQFDKDGFLSRKGAMFLEFDSFSRLKRTFEGDLFDVRYLEY